MENEVVKKKYPMVDESGQPCAFPTFASQVFSDRANQVLYQESGGICVDNSNMLSGLSADQYAQKTDIMPNSVMLGGLLSNQYALKTDIPEYTTVDILSFYPVGSVYMSISGTSPAALFGGTWELIKNRFLIGAGGSYANGGTGGKTSYALRAAIGAISNHQSHIGYCYTSKMSYQSSTTSGCYGLDSSSADISKWNHSTIVTEHTSTSSSTTIIPSYLAVYIWERIA